MAKKHKNRWIVPNGEPMTELDKRILDFQSKGALVPTRNLIKTPEQIEGIRQAGRINTAALDLAQREIKAGMTTGELDQLIHDFIIAQGATPACLGYEGFPKSCCISINEVVCHGIPSDEEEFWEGDIVNVDITTIYKGYYADASRMFIIGKTSPECEKLVRVAKECLEIGMTNAKPWGYVGEIGKAIEKHAHKNGYSVVRDLAGHGTGLAFHEEPEVDHYNTRQKGMLLVPGMVFTIEPMINMGTYEVFVDEEDGWTVVTEDEKPSAQW
jgi:methionyl aminopeptidase